MSQTWQVAEDQIIDLAAASGVPVATVQVGLIAGEVLLVAGLEPRVEISNIAGRPVDVEIRDGHLTVRHPQVRWDGLLDTLKGLARRDDRATVTVTMPAQAQARVSTASAAVTVRGLTGRTAIRSVSGPLVAELPLPPAGISLKSVSGDLSVSLAPQAGYRLDARSVSGRIVADGRLLGAGRPGPPQGEVRTGDESVHISAITVSGSVTLDRLR